MVDLTYIDHVETGLSLLPSQWEDKPVIRGVLASWLQPLNVTEQQALDVRDGFNVNTAIGLQLDFIGEYFGEKRLGRDDEDYRNAILSIIASSNGSGTPPQLQSLYQTLTRADTVGLWEHYPLSVSLLSNGGTDTNIDIYGYMADAKAAGVQYAALMYNPLGYVWIPNDVVSFLANVVQSPTNDNVVIDTGDNVVANSIVEDVDNGSQKSSFIDESIPEPEEVGYGKNYGRFYGGSRFFTSQFADTVTLEGQDFSGGNGFLPWAEQEELDPITGTPNKVEPIPQFADSGLKKGQPMPRQFFNYLVAKIDDWFSFISKKSDVGSLKYTFDFTQTAADYNARYGGTWELVGTETLSMQAGGTENIKVFVRTA